MKYCKNKQEANKTLNRIYDLCSDELREDLKLVINSQRDNKWSDTEFDDKQNQKTQQREEYERLDECRKIRKEMGNLQTRLDSVVVKLENQQNNLIKKDLVKTNDN